jgi:hypothetical protein
MKRLGILLTATVGLAARFHAADLPTIKLNNRPPSPTAGRASGAGSTRPPTTARSLMPALPSAERWTLALAIFSQGAAAAGWDEASMDIVT